MVPWSKFQSEFNRHGFLPGTGQPGILTTLSLERRFNGTTVCPLQRTALHTLRGLLCTTRLNPTRARNWRCCAWFGYSKASITSLTWHFVNLINDPIKSSYTSTVCSMAVTRWMLRKKRWLRWSPLLRFLSLQIRTVCCIRPLVTIVCIESGAYAMTFGIYRQIVTAAQPDF